MYGTFTGHAVSQHTNELRAICAYAICADTRSQGLLAVLLVLFHNVHHTLQCSSGHSISKVFSR